MTTIASDTSLIEAKESPNPTIVFLNQSHLKKEAVDIGYNDIRDLKDKVQLRLTLADVAILYFEGQPTVIKESKTVNLFTL